MSNLFISHSSEDSAALQPFLDLLILGMGINQENIFCTQQKGTLAIGEDFMDKIKQELHNCKKVICFITPNYLKSISCLVEMGAAWLQTGKVVPMLVKPLTFSDLNNTPLAGLQAIMLDDTTGLFQLYDELCRCSIAQTGKSSALSSRADEFVKQQKSSNIILPDKNGYYIAEIEQIRNTPPTYRCYKIKGLLKLAQKPFDGETHWIFFKTGMYPELSVGDRIKFSIDSTELRSFHDLKNARNIYPMLLEKL